MARLLLLALIPLACLGGCGDDSAAIEMWNRGYEALQRGAWREAEQAAAQAARAGADRARCDFLRGCAVFEQARLAAKQADTPMAEPFVFDVAIRYVETALQHWQSALMADEASPHADALRRNIARAHILRDDLEQKKKAAVDRTRRPPRPNPKGQDPGAKDPPKTDKPKDAASKPPPDPSKTDAPAPTNKLPQTSLTADEVKQLLDRLETREREKRVTREKRMRARSAEVDRDW